MAEIERTRVRERSPIPQNDYEFAIKKGEVYAERARTAPLVIKRSDREWQMTRQGRIMYYMMTGIYNDVPLQDWRIFVHDIKTHSGKHRHQGGLVIYVLEGTGYSIVDGERKDWGKGDLLLLPIRPGGVEHQHFNSQPGKGCMWVAFFHEHIMENLALLIEQVEESPQYKSEQK